jgi:hypothetical protein
MSTQFCGRCGAINPSNAPFCGKCGRPLAARDSSNVVSAAPATTSHEQRTTNNKQRTTPAGPPSKLGSLRLWLIVGGVIVLASVGLGITAYALRPQAVDCSPPKCVIKPPTSHALPPEATPYTSSKYGFSIDYTLGFAPTSIDDSSVRWSGSLHDGSAFDYAFTGDSANGRSAQQVVQDIQRSKYPGAQAAYPPDGIPGADLGFTPGYGQVYDVFTSGGRSTHERVVIIAAIQGDTAVSMVGEGPWRQPTEQSDGHPNPSDVSFVGLGEYMVSVTSVRWKGEPPL